MTENKSISTHIQLLYCGDSGIEQGLVLSLLSVAEVVKRPLQVYVMTTSLTHGDKCYRTVSRTTADYLDRMLKQYHPQSAVILIDCSERFVRELPEANLDSRFTPLCMLRLFADYEPALQGKILYLDNDVLCLRDFSDFYDQDMTGIEIAGVPDYYGRWVYSPIRRDYINSGVLLMNMDLIRGNGLFAKCRDFCRKTRRLLPDQEAINRFAQSKRICHRRYNDQRRLHEDTVLQHFSTTFRIWPIPRSVTVKPWDFEAVHKILKLDIYNSLFEKYKRHKNELNL
ncbi:MAG: hypothetical protein J5808_00825 [Paludibacteraceae bacterium]|nr:hypothetical protein [Paludibacteraceae bacterium]